MAELSLLDDYPDALLELASLNKNDDIHPFIDELAHEDEKENDGKLLF